VGPGLVLEAGSPWRASGEIFCVVSRRHWGGLSLKRDSPSVVAILITRSALSPSSSPCCSVVVAAMALLDPPECFQTEVALNLVRNLLEWGVPAFSERIHVDDSPHGDLAVEEFVLFVSNLPSGLALPISSFFLLSLEENGLMGVALFRQCSVSRMFISLGEVESELSCGSIFRMNFIASGSGLVVRHYELVELWLRSSGQATGRHVPPCFQLFGFNGPDVASNDEGSLVLAHAPRRPPPPASRPEGHTGRHEDGGRALSARPCWCRVVRTCRNGARTPLEGGCNNFCLCKVLLSTTYRAVLALICILFVPVVCGVADSSQVPGPPGM
jgi:hypothetical protein